MLTRALGSAAQFAVRPRLVAGYIAGLGSADQGQFGSGDRARPAAKNDYDHRPASAHILPHRAAKRSPDWRRVSLPPLQRPRSFHVFGVGWRRTMKVWSTPPGTCRGRRHEVSERAGCGKTARPVRRAATGNGAMAWTEAPASRKRRQQLLPTSYRHRASRRLYPTFVARARRCRCDKAHGPNDAEGVADTTSKRLEGVRLVIASRSASAAGSW